MRVLVVDINVIQRYYLKAQLEETGFLVDFTDNIKQAELYISSNKPDIILMNVDSIERESIAIICKWSRQWRNTKIMLLNKRNDLLHKVKALNSGADDYIIMPCHIQEIIIRIRVIVRRGFCLPNQQISIGDVSLDLSSKFLYISDNSIRLTAFEFEIMYLLMKNKGKVLSKQRIINHLYDTGFVRNNNSIEVLIGRLRKKMLLCNKAEIKNKRSAGYYFQYVNT